MNRLGTCKIPAISPVGLLIFARLNNKLTRVKVQIRRPPIAPRLKLCIGLITIAALRSPHSLWSRASSARNSRFLDMDFILFIPETYFGLQTLPAYQCIYSFGYVWVNHKVIAFLDFNQHVKCWRSTAFEHSLLRAAPASFFI